jgi:hypothetical protein
MRQSMTEENTRQTAKRSFLQFSRTLPEYGNFYAYIQNFPQKKLSESSFLQIFLKKLLKKSASRFSFQKSALEKITCFCDAKLKKWLSNNGGKDIKNT